MKIPILVAAALLAMTGLGHSARAAEAIRSTFCRAVPERADDFAWENDLVAFRAYGPALRAKAENSGIDCWLKRVSYPIIDRWYAQDAKGKSYHEDHGEGLDCYHVGSSAGTGGTGLWLNGKREPLEAYVTFKIFESSRERSRFKLTYEREIDGVVYSEEKTITIELGEQLFRAHSVFRKNGRIAAGLPVCVGVTTHDGRAAAFSNRAEGWIACWEKMDDSELGTAVRMAPDRIGEIKPVEATQPDGGHILILATTDAQGAIDYEAGYGWKKAGVLTTRSEWAAYLGAHRKDSKG
jgi:hypothetical protein